MPREKKATSGSNAGSRCTSCWKQPGAHIFAHQGKRHQHFLSFPYGSVLKAHLLEQYGADGEKDGSVNAILSWYYFNKPAPAEKPPGMAIDSRDFTEAPEAVWADDR